MSDGNNPHNPGGQVYIDPETGQPVAQPQIDPATGQPVVAQPHIDPATGQPIAPQPPIDPATGQPVSPHAASQPVAPVENQAFGFTEAPVQEKYNTEYIVKNMQKDERTTQYVIIALVVAALAGAGMWLMLMPEPEKPALPAAGAPTEAEPAANDKTGEPAASDETGGTGADESDAAE